MQDNIDYQNVFDISEIISKSFKGKLTLEEEKILTNWFELDTRNKYLYDRLSKKYNSGTLESITYLDKNLAWQKVSKHIENKSHPKYLKYAASFIGISLLAGSLYYFQNFSRSTLYTNSNTVVEKFDSKAQKNGVILTLADGKQLNLISDDVFKWTDTDNSNIKKNDNGSLSYGRSNGIEKELKYNSVRTPRGTTYQIILPDETKVWLSSDSYLKYPVSFIGSERRVQLVGEAYFEVSKDVQKPFYVDANQTEIKVLGTHFNVSAYNDDRSVHTTLVEGSVKVKNNSNEIILKSGEEVVDSFGNGGKLKVEKADLELNLAWKNGLFIFRDEPLGQIMKRIARWYDVDVVFEQESFRNIPFGGKFSKDNTLDELLNSMSLTGVIKFKKDERRVTIMAK